jgi:hypothetical protein
MLVVVLESCSKYLDYVHMFVWSAYVKAGIYYENEHTSVNT